MFLGFFSKSSRKHLNITPYFMDFSWSKNLLTKFEGHSIFQTQSICKNKKKRNFHHFINNSAQNATETLYPSEWRRRSYSLTFEGIFLLVCKKFWNINKIELNKSWEFLQISLHTPHVKKTITFNLNVLTSNSNVESYSNIRFEFFARETKCNHY